VYGISRDHAGLLLDVGLGKTYVSINIARYRIQRNNVNKVLVVCPTTLFENWRKQIKRFSEYDATILHHTNKKERNEIIKNTSTYFDIINYEAIHLYRDSLINNDYDMIIFDESARYLKGPRTKRTKASHTLARNAKFTLILTGTVIEKRPDDVWAQFYVLNNGKSFSDNFFAFKNYYFHRTKRYKRQKNPITKKEELFSWTEWSINPNRFDTLRNHIFECCIQYRKREVLKDLPDIITKEIPLPLEGKIKDIYSDIQDEVMKELREALVENNKVNITNILTKQLRLQQITAGFIKNDSGEEVELSVTPKLDALVEEVISIAEADESVVIWCIFKKSIKMIKERLQKEKIKCITMDGDTKDKYGAWKGFQTSNVPAFIGQVKAGGIGIELFKENSDKAKSQYTIFYENPWTPGVRDQAKGRTDRIGQKSKVVYVDIYIENTIDQRVLEVLRGEKEIADIILDIKEGKL
jgi:SNF2 family DNA or RNA helicase